MTLSIASLGAHPTGTPRIGVVRYGDMKMRLAIAALVAGACGCGNSNASSSDDPPPVPAAPPKSKALPGIEVFVNDQSITRLTPDQIQGWVQLPGVLPMQDRRQGMWSQISIKGRGEQPQVLTRPSDAYPDQIPALYPGDNGTLAFGMFQPVEFARHGAASMSVDGAREVRITVDLNSGRGQNDDGNSAVGDPRTIELTIKGPKGPQTIKGDKLIATPFDPSPNGSKDQGWKLTTLLANAGVTAFKQLILTDATGAKLTLDKTDVSDTSVPFVKMNKQAKLKVRVWKKNGDGWTEAKNLRELKSIDVI
jgi:hypothetical protein